MLRNTSGWTANGTGKLNVFAKSGHIATSQRYPNVSDTSLTQVDATVTLSSYDVSQPVNTSNNNMSSMRSFKPPAITHESTSEPGRQAVTSISNRQKPSKSNRQGGVDQKIVSIYNNMHPSSIHAKKPSNKTARPSRAAQGSTHKEDGNRNQNQSKSGGNDGQGGSKTLHEKLL